MAELDLDFIERETARFDTPYARDVLRLVAEVRQLRASRGALWEALDGATDALDEVTADGGWSTGLDGWLDVLSHHAPPEKRKQRRGHGVPE